MHNDWVISIWLTRPTLIGESEPTASVYRIERRRASIAFLHAARVGLFELSWNVLCRGCGGVLDANTSLKTVHEDAYTCALCGAGYEPTLDEMVEVSFTVNPRVRRIAAHDPHTLPMWEYQRQIFWSTGIDLPENFDDILAEIVLDSIELPPGERASLSLQVPQQFVIVFEPVTHSAWLGPRGHLPPRTNCDARAARQGPDGDDAALRV